MTIQLPASTLTEAHLTFLRSVDSPTIANAVEVFNVRDRTDGFIGGAVRALFPDLGVMVGQALTVTVGNEPGEVASRDGYWRMWRALEQMPAPTVLVMQDVCGQPSRCAYAGEVMATLAQRLGAVGMVTDGGYRDVDEVRALGMHYYAAYHVVSHGNFAVLDVGVPVELDGQRIETGDILHGDINGIVVVPPQVLDGLPEAVAQIRDRERRVMEFIRGESFSLEGVKGGRGY
ncbi:MAG: 4-hydroxy-4-methyl-2-oxoglutarate aldolase [Thermomicrobiales bacterium]|nr:4-hydroxy-4-methyl-2-oxoglutarate aldolase [Thermomicrobiales bacterium]